MGLRKLLGGLIQEELKKSFCGNSTQPLPVGYNPIEVIRGALLVWIAVPFNGKDIWCQLRCPNATQLEQCGDISNIVLPDSSGKERKFEYDEIIKIRNYQEELCKISFNNPTFNQIMKLVGGEDNFIKNKRLELQNLLNKFEDNKDKLGETEKKTIDTQIKTIELQLGFLIPDDTMAFITKWAMGNDISDVKKLNREILLRAASLAKAHNKAPTDYISGVFTDFNKHEIDSYAGMILNEYMADEKAVTGRYRWIGRDKMRLSDALPRRTK